MNRQELRTQFQDFLNRTDSTDVKADMFLDWGLRRAERVIRTPFQRQLLEYIIGDTYPGYIVVPGGYLGLDWIKVNGIGLTRVGATQEGEFCDEPGTPENFWVENEQIHFRPNLTVGDVVRLNYYAEQTLGDDDDVSPGSLIVPDLVIFSALVFAGIHFTDQRLPEFKGTLKELVTEIQNMADMDNFVQGSISTPNEGYY